jgi:hypothetical protein
MLRRGSAQLLLLFFRSRARLGWIAGGLIGVLLIAGMGQARDFPLLGRLGVAQMMRQSAWQHALAGLPSQAWPWAAEEPAEAGTKVPRLGLSAVIDKDEETVIEPSPPAAGEKPGKPRTKLSEVNVGDHITLTTADGTSRVYRVMGRGVVDPHLADPDNGAREADTLVACVPLDPLLASSLRLVIEAATPDQPPQPAPKPEQKL